MLRRLSVTSLCLIFCVAFSHAQGGGDKGLYYKLFLPPTFYHDNSSLAADSTTDEVLRESIDRAMMHIYLYRPDLVTETESHLQRVGGLLSDSTINKPTQTESDEFVFAPVVMSTGAEPEVKPLDIVIKKPNFWTFKQDYFFQILQNFFSDNWYKGGEKNYSMLAQTVLEANYNNKQKVKWENKLELKFGLQTQESDSLHKYRTSDDLIRLTSSLGLQAHKNWYYSMKLQLYSQFAAGVKSNDHKIYSDFMSPFDLDLALGMDYKLESKKCVKDSKEHVLTGSLNLAPLTYHLRYVDRLALSKSYGLDEGKHALNTFGSSLTLTMKWQASRSFKYETRLWAYCTFDNVQAEWENTFTLQLSRLISAKLFLYPRFDDKTERDEKNGYFQFREYSSIGFAYSL